MPMGEGFWIHQRSGRPELLHGRRCSSMLVNAYAQVHALKQADDG